jgi:hypothetical protein
MCEKLAFVAGFVYMITIMAIQLAILTAIILGCRYLYYLV